MSTGPISEAERLRKLDQYAILDTPPEVELDEIVALAAAICGTPVALVSLIGETRQWFKARVGLDASETSRNVAFCAAVVEREDEALFVVDDARNDPRFATNPMVTGDPNVVFYAAAPLVVEGGAKLGTLCVIDREPRQLSAIQQQALVTLSRVVVRHLELRRAIVSRATAERELSRIFDLSIDLLGWATPEGVLQRVNPAFERTLGWTAEELYSRPIHGFVHPDDREATEAERARAAAGATVIKFEHRFRCKDGTYRWLSWSAAPADGVNYLVARDVTVEKETADARAQLHAATRVSHEVAERANRSTSSSPPSPTSCARRSTRCSGGLASSAATPSPNRAGRRRSRPSSATRPCRRSSSRTSSTSRGSSPARCGSTSCPWSS